MAYATTRRDGSRLLESSVEGHLEKQMKRIGGRAYKFPPAVKGNPDRIVVFPFGRIYFVELKRDSKSTPEPAQLLWHERAYRMGHVVHVLDSREMIDDFIRWALATGPGLLDTVKQRAKDRDALRARYKVNLEGMKH